MDWISKKNILIVGLGLMGGSYARGLKRLGFHVTAIDRDPETVAWALDHDVVDQAYDHVEEAAVQDADAAIFALYPATFLKWIRDWQYSG